LYCLHENGPELTRGSIIRILFSQLSNKRLSTVSQDVSFETNNQLALVIDPTQDQFSDLDKGLLEVKNSTTHQWLLT
jgi:hypothetical protein